MTVEAGTAARGRTVASRGLTALAAAAGFLAVTGPSPAGAATQIGETFVPNSFCGSDVTRLQSVSPGAQYAVPSAGVITSWSTQASGSPVQLKFKVAHPEGGSSFTIIGESDLTSPAAGTFNTYSIRVPVRAGDLIGLYNMTSGECQRDTGSDYSIQYMLGDTPAQTTAVFDQGGNVQLDVSALLEPDADGDGFGDETQDECPTDASTQGDCAPPNTTISKGPNDKTRKKTATFEFTSNEPGSSFQCSLDGKSTFKPCSSPLTIQVKKGRHSFEVQATDQAGNVDGTPATDDWKVRKKRRK
jgi:hypothetical protein